MGWGILFVGYLFLLSIPMHAIGVCAEVLGYILMLRALTLLGAHETCFLRARTVCAVLIPFGLYSFVVQCFHWFGFSGAETFCTEHLSLPVSIVLAALLLLFHVFLLGGIRKLAKEVELPDIVRQVNRNRIMTVVYFALTVAVSFLNIPAVTDVISYGDLVSIVAVVGMIWIILCAKMIFNCYMWICMPEDLDMPERDRVLPRIFTKEPEKAADPEEEKRLAFEKINAEARAREEKKTKKNKRHKHR